MSQRKETFDRKCKHCGKEYRTTAKEIKEHANLCARAAAIGLKLSGGVTLR